MATKKTAPKLTAAESKKITEALSQTLKALDPQVINKISKAVGTRKASVDVNVCGSKCF